MARDNKIVNDAISRPWTPAINSATNKVATEQIKVPSDKAPKTVKPNPIYNVSSAENTRCITDYIDRNICLVDR